MKRLLFLLSFIPFLAVSQKTLYYNARVFTGNPDQPWASYFVVENGFITTTGTGAYPDSIENKVDLQSKVVIPGMVDSHIHFIDGGLTLLQTSFDNVHNAGSLEEALASTRQQLIDGVYVGRNLAPDALHSTASPILMLDHFFPSTPAIIFLKGGHAAIANHAAMKSLNFGPRTKIQDGYIGVDSSGMMTGYLFESAAMEANRIVSSRFSEETIRKAIQLMQSKVLSYGITTIGDNTFDPFNYKIYQEMVKSGLLQIRVHSRSFGRVPQTEMLMKGLGRKHLGFIGEDIDPAHVNHYATKIFADRTLSASPDLEPTEPGGTPFYNTAELTELFQLHPHSNFAFHVQGKEGIGNILKAIRSTKDQRRHILDHAGYVSAEQLEEIRNLQLAVTMIGGQLFDSKALLAHYSKAGHFVPQDFLNPRMKYQIAGAALSSDFPYGMDTVFAGYPKTDGLNPFPIIAAHVEGRYPDGSLIPGMDQKTLTLEEALFSYTSRGAFAVFDEQRVGKIEKGYRADFSILDRDIFSTPAFELYGTRVEKTYIDGQPVFDSGLSQTQKNSSMTQTRPSDYAVSPIIGYDPSLGMILGGAYFRFPLRVPGKLFDVQLQTISKGKFSLQSNYVFYGIRKNLNLNISASYSTFFQYYFGEGNTTTSDNYSILYANNLKFRPELNLLLPNLHQLNFFADVRARQETGVTDKNGTDLGQSLFPDGTNAAVGISFQKDTRDNAFSTHKGTFKQISLQYIPEAWNSKGLGEVLQVTGEIRHFRYVHDSRFVIATRLAAGYSAGSADYLFRYNLGGAYALRGYYANRFRGNQYYVGQLEFRFPLYKRLSGAAFTDAGDVTDDGFRKPKWTWGAGIRFALNENIKLRLDYGIAKDQRGVFFTFSEAF